MATLVLGAVGAAIGGSIGGTFLGLTAASIGFSVGATLGSFVDRQLFSPEPDMRTGPRLGDLSIQVSTYGRMIPLVYGGRAAGNVIWATDKREVRVVTASSAGGGKGGGATTTTSEEYHYYVSLAVSLGQGPIAGLRRIWADGAVIWDCFDKGNSIDGVTVHLGTDGQDPDAVIEAQEGAGNVPGYRGQAYVVFEDFHLNPYGGRIPNFTFDVDGLLAAGWGEENAQGVCEGADGDLWLVSNLQRTVTRLDRESFAVKAVIGRTAGDAGYLGGLPAQPWRICREPVTGHLFVTCLADACVLRIDPASNAVTATIPVAYYPHEIAADGAGGVWVTHPWQDLLTRIDAGTGVSESVALSGQPYALCADPSGRLWISCSGEIVHFDPLARAELKRIALDAKWFPGGLTWNAGDGRVWFACSGNDVIGIVNPATYAVSWRNSGTWPAYAASHADDDRHTVFVSMFFGNRVKLLRRGADNGLDEIAEFKAEAWPGPLAALADGRCLASNTDRRFFQEIRGP